MVNCQNGLLGKWSTRKMVNWQNGQLAKWSTRKMVNWQNGQLAKWSSGKRFNSESRPLAKFTFKTLYTCQCQLAKLYNGKIVNLHRRQPAKLPGNFVTLHDVTWQRGAWQVVTWQTDTGNLPLVKKPTSIIRRRQ